MVTLYGIKNCDTVRKARRWLEQHGVDYRFHDLRDDGLSRSRLTAWVKELGWEALLNRRATTWRQLPAARRDALDHAKAVDLMLEHPTLIKRPVLEIENRHYPGFKEERYSELFS
jgi:arsenate reductase